MNLKTYALALTLLGCRYEPQYLEGTVVREEGTAIHLAKSSGAILGNESVKLDRNYVLVVDVNNAPFERDRGSYTINVEDHWKKPLSAIAEAINPGDRIKFTTVDSDGRHYFDGGDKIGSIDSTLIEVLGR